MRLVAAALVAAAALATPAQAAPPELVTIERNPPVNCVRFPCFEQPPPYTVCVVPLHVCTPR